MTMVTKMMLYVYQAAECKRIACWRVAQQIERKGIGTRDQGDL